MRTNSYKQLRSRLVNMAKKDRRPILGHFELTARCNLDCKMCYVHTQDNAEALKRELTTEQWKNIFDEAYDAGMIYASLSGGECLIRKDFKDLYLYLWNKKIYVTVLTNGTMLNDDYVEFFKTYPPDVIQISLYGSNEDAYLNVTGHKGFEKALYAISSLNSSNIDVRVAITPSKYMREDFVNIVRLCKDNGFYFLNTDILLIENRDDSSKDDYFLTHDEIVALSIERYELFKKASPVIDAPLPGGTLSNAPERGLKCNAGTCLATVTWDGMMYPCYNAMVGGTSLLEYSYSDAWEIVSKAASEVALGVECAGCAYNETCPKCPSIRLKDYTSGHCKPSMCELTHRLVSAGVKKIVKVESNCD